MRSRRPKRSWYTGGQKWPKNRRSPGEPRKQLKMTRKKRARDAPLTVTKPDRLRQQSRGARSKNTRGTRAQPCTHARSAPRREKKTSEKKMRDQLGRSQLAALKWMVRRMGSSAHHIGRPRREVGRGPTRIHQSDLTRSVDLGVCQIRSDIFWTITRSVRSDRFGTIEKQG